MVLIAVTLFSLGNSSDMFLVMRAQNVGIRVALAPLLGLVFNITYTLGSWPAGWFSDRFSRRWIAAAGYLIFAAVYFVFGRAPSTLAIWITMAVYGLYYALTQPVLKALVVETVAPDVRGRALGIYFFVTSVATLAASLITGELWKLYGAAVPFYLSAGLAALSSILLSSQAWRLKSRDIGGNLPGAPTIQTTLPNPLPGRPNAADRWGASIVNRATLATSSSALNGPTELLAFPLNIKRNCKSGGAKNARELFSVSPR